MLTVSGGGVVGVSGSIIVDRYGNIYFSIGPTLGKSLTIVSVSHVGGWIAESSNPNPTTDLDMPNAEESKSFLTGLALNASGGLVIGGGETYVGNIDGTERGFYSPQIGVALTFLWLLYDSGKK
jgi:hypothetical protein